MMIQLFNSLITKDIVSGHAKNPPIDCMQLPVADQSLTMLVCQLVSQSVLQLQRLRIC